MSNSNYYAAEAALRHRIMTMSEAQLRATLFKASKEGTTAFNRELFRCFNIEELPPEKD